MAYSINVKVIKELPVEKINRYTDRVVYSIARNTLDLTVSNKAFPYLTGDLQRDSMANGVINTGHLSYSLGARNIKYAPKVWTYTNVKWTNPNTQPQWFVSVYKKYEHNIVERAIHTAEEVLK